MNEMKFTYLSVEKYFSTDDIWCHFFMVIVQAYWWLVGCCALFAPQLCADWVREYPPVCGCFIQYFFMVTKYFKWKIIAFAVIKVFFSHHWLDQNDTTSDSYVAALSSGWTIVGLFYFFPVSSYLPWTCRVRSWVDHRCELSTVNWSAVQMYREWRSFRRWELKLHLWPDNYNKINEKKTMTSWCQLTQSFLGSCLRLSRWKI